MLFTILQFTGHPPLTKNYQAYSVSGTKTEELQDKDWKGPIQTQKKGLVASKHTASLVVNERQIIVCFYY